MWNENIELQKSQVEGLKICSEEVAKLREENYNLSSVINIQ